MYAHCIMFYTKKLIHCIHCMRASSEKQQHPNCFDLLALIMFCLICICENEMNLRSLTVLHYLLIQLSFSCAQETCLRIMHFIISSGVHLLMQYYVIFNFSSSCCYCRCYCYCIDYIYVSMYVVYHFNIHLNRQRHLSQVNKNCPFHHSNCVNNNN